MPYTTPDAEPTLATAVLLLVHVPPVVASLRLMVPPVQTEAGPEMEATEVVTVTA